MPKLNISTLDRLSKRTSMSLGVDSGATNVELQAVADAVDAIILGANVSAEKVVSETIDAGSAVPPTSNLANVTSKWLCRIQDTDGNIFTHEIGTADVSQLPSSTVDYLDLTAGVGAALKTAIEAVYESPYGNTGTLLSVQEVSRAG